MKKIIFILLISLVFISNGSSAIKDSIFATIGNEVITNSDIINEIKKILILSNTAYSDDIKKKVEKISVNSIIKGTIKNIEIKKYGSLTFNEKDIANEVGRLAANINVSTDVLKKKFADSGINFSVLTDRIAIDLLWNSLIFQLYNSRLQVNANEIDDQLKIIKKQDKNYEYLISEIIIKPISEENSDNILKEIFNKIEIEGFGKVAKEISISESSTNGGNLGWINLNSISSQFRSKIVSTEIGKLSDPVFLPQGIIFFKINDKRSVNQTIDLEDLKNELVAAEKNKILNMFSLSHYDKLRRTVSIIYY